MRGKMEFPSYTPDFDPLDQGVIRCEDCDGPIEVSNYYIYLGEPYHRGVPAR